MFGIPYALANDLSATQNKFADSRESLKTITPGNVGKEIMVPMTSSLYVKGSLADADNVLVDIGTGIDVRVRVSPRHSRCYLLSR